MIFRILNSSLLVRLIILAGLSVGLGFSIASFNLWWIISSSFFLIISVLELLNKVNAVNRKLTYFFDAVRNEDSSLHFPEKIYDKSTQHLHESLNRLNTLISEIKIRNEYKERFYRELLKYSATGIIAVDEEGYIDLINKAALQLIGMEQLGHIKLLQQKRKGLHDELIQLKPGQTQTLKILQKQELQLISVKVTKLFFGEKRFRVFSLYDIKAELEENEVDSWQKLIRVLTHEIMNSIAPITSLSKTLRRLLQSNMNFEGDQQVDLQVEKAREGLSVIEETGKGLMHFIDNYRRLTKIPKPVFKVVKIKKWINRVYCLLKDRLDEENIDFEQHYNIYQTEFLADEKLLTQVLINIINNAIDASLSKEKRKIELRVETDRGARLQISITDYGKGIAGDELDKIFIPFFTTKENGSGVGLSISRQIMRLHKGSISVSSQADKKTTFFLRL